MTTKSEFIEKNEAAIEKAKKTGKITRLGSGQYYLFAGNVLYSIDKRDYLGMNGWGHEWTWSIDGKAPDDGFSTFAEAKKALFAYLDENNIPYSLTALQSLILSWLPDEKGKSVKFYDKPYSTNGAKNAVKSLIKKGLVNAKFSSSSTQVEVWKA